METIKGVKAFDNGLRCKNFQFRENEIFTHEGNIKICESGFHFCENPLDVLNYYDLCDSEFAEVEAVGEIEKHDKDSKVTTNKLKIGIKIDLKRFIALSLEYLKTNSNINDSSKVATSGNSSKVATSGDFSKVATSGYFSQVATSGDSSKVATSGYSSKVATSGYSSKVATSGYSSKVATSGYFSKVATSGDFSQVATSGDSSNVTIKGLNSVAANIGVNGTVKAALGTWITLAEYDGDYTCICVKSAKIDGEILKADTWYKLINGEFIEIN